jgi:hypothetical protein
MTYFELFFVAFFLNLLYELLHSVLYTTCLEAPLKKYVYLMLKAAIFDGIVIMIMYYATNLISHEGWLIAFLIASLLFAYLWEIYSLKVGKWRYAKTMPVILGVGVTPLLQLPLTGFLSLCIVIHFFV